MSQVLSSTGGLLPKDLRFEHGGAKLVSCSGRHLTFLHPCWLHQSAQPYAFRLSASFKKQVYIFYKVSKVGMLQWTWWLLTLARQGRLC